MSGPADRRIPLDQDRDPEKTAGDRGLTRRAALQGIAGSVGAALGAGSAAGADPHPVVAHVVQRQAGPGPRPAKPPGRSFLDPHQLATLTLVAEVIVPGAAASGSPRFIDEMLAVERPDVQQRFVGALGAIDAAARERHGKPFRDVPRASQIELLEAAAAEPSGRPDTAPKEPEDMPDRPDASLRVQGLRDPFDHLKTWIAGAHYSSEAGMKELGWTGGRFFPSFPGCTHQGGHE
jgi:hypothetical protein